MVNFLVINWHSCRRLNELDILGIHFHHERKRHEGEDEVEDNEWATELLLQYQLAKGEGGCGSEVVLEEMRGKVRVDLVVLQDVEEHLVH